MRSLVTGAAGFIGSHLCEALLERGDEVVGIDDLSKGRLENLSSIGGNPDFTFHKVSVADAVIEDLVAAADVVYHLAAVVGVKMYVEDPALVVESNVTAMANLMRLAWKHGRKVLFTSTSEVYGKSLAVPFREDSDRLYGPSEIDRWCYAVSKSAAEHLCLGYARRGLPVVIVRYFNVYGPRAETSEYGGVVPIFIRQALSGQPLTVHGDGTQTRCFTHVSDIVRGTIAAGTDPRAEGRVFNLGSRRETPIRDLAKLVIELTGSPAGYRLEPYADFYGDYYEDIPRRVPDLSAAEDILGYRPTIALEEGLKLTINWYRRRGRGFFR